MRSSSKNQARLEPGDRMFAVLLMEHLVVPTFVLGPDGNVLIWNRACERLTGLPASEVVGTNHHWRAFYDAPRPCLADLVLGGQAGEIGALYEEHQQVDPDRISLSAENWCGMPRLGNRRYLAIDAGPIFSETGDLVAVVETLRDITAQREAQLALQAMASMDGLTGLANRRRFDECLVHEWRRAERARLPVSLLMIDVDHFKSFNDAAGHQAGDECLRQIASALSGEVLRPGDQAARFGGEEFAVILPNTELNGALVVAERILSAVASLALPHPDPSKGPVVTLSIGAAEGHPSRRRSPESLIREADLALYQAKQQGRARVAQLAVLEAVA